MASKKSISEKIATHNDKVTRDVAADIAADLLGSPAKMTKAANKIAVQKAKGKKAKAAVKAAINGKPSGQVGRPSPYTDKQRIVIVGKGMEPRKGSNIAKIWAMVAKSKTIADYKKQRAAAGLEGIGGLFAGLVKAGHVKVQ